MALVIKERLNTIPVNESAKFNKLSIWNMYGISATGKGTRLSQVLSYLFATQPHTKIGIEVTKEDGRKKVTPFGYFFPESKIFIIGKFVRSNKAGRLYSFNSHDYMISNVTHGIDQRIIYDSMVRAIRAVGAEYVIFEGYPCMWGQAGLLEMLDKYVLTEDEKSRIKINSLYFYYPAERDVGFEELQKRVVGRSGARIKGTCWGGNSLWEKTASLHEAGKHDVHESRIGFGKGYLFDAPVTVFGECLFGQEPELNKYLDGFMEFSKSFDTKRDVSNPEANYEMFESIYSGEKSGQFEYLVPENTELVARWKAEAEAHQNAEQGNN